MFFFLFFYLHKNKKQLKLMELNNELSIFDFAKNITEIFLFDVDFAPINQNEVYRIVSLLKDGNVTSVFSIKPDVIIEKRFRQAFQQLRIYIIFQQKKGTLRDLSNVYEQLLSLVYMNCTPYTTSNEELGMNRIRKFETFLYNSLAESIKMTHGSKSDMLTACLIHSTRMTQDKIVETLKTM